MRYPYKSRLILPLLGLLLCLMGNAAGAQESDVSSSWTSVTVGVADLDQALEIWVETLGFSQLAKMDGDDPELATLWRILPEDIQRQALLGMPDSAHGQLHLVEFREPGPAVREGARVTDSGPQSLVVYARDLKAQVKQMQEDGFTFFSAEPVESSLANGIRLSEIRLGLHDEVSLLLRELHGAEMNFNARGFSGIIGLVNVVEFAQAERDFYQQILGLQLLAERSIEGTELEQVMGLATGAVLETSSWGNTTDSSGQIELGDYRFVTPGNNLYPVAVPTQLGILHVSYAVTDLDEFKQKLHAAGLSFNDREYRDTPYAKGRFIRFRTPAGMNLEAFE
jgi:catechol 2,3-dioxygenase-like lactoylglutathione lyase family enzyme